MINSYDGFTQLEEVWLGDVWPAHFYDDLPRDIRDVFWKITEWTQQDLNEIQKKIESFGVTVRRPIIDRPADHFKNRGVLTKPPITPRDYNMVMGQQLFMQYLGGSDFEVWKEYIDSYRLDQDQLIETATRFPMTMSGSNTVRLGRDFYLDCVYDRSDCEYYSGRNIDPRAAFDSTVVPFFSDHKCHYIDNGGHVDGCFALLKPGLLLTTAYFQDYESFYPGWTHIQLSKPEFFDSNKDKGWYDDEFSRNGRWHLGDINIPHGFNQYVQQYAADWIGNYTETYFEVNCLVINPENVLVLGSNNAVTERLAEAGMTAHEVPFRCRTFWDGGLHCLTVDVKRQGGLIDYFDQSSAQ